MPARLLVVAAAAGILAVGVVLATRGGGAESVMGTIGVNRVPMRTEQATYRLTLDGRALRTGGAPATFAQPGVAAPGGRYRLDFSTPGVTVVDARTGARQVLTTDPYAARAYWGPASTLAFTDRRDRLTRLLILDPASGARRVVASHLCGDAVVNPWSPDGRSLAIPVSPPGGGCNGHGGSEVAVTDPARGGMRRLTEVGTTPVTWNRDGSRLLIADNVLGALRLVDPRSGKGRAVLPSVSSSIEGTWSKGRRFYAAFSDQTVSILDGSLQHLLRVIAFVQQYAWSPRRQWLAISEKGRIRVLDADTARTVSVIPARTPHGLSVQSLAWEQGGRALVAVAQPEAAPLGHD